MLIENIISPDTISAFTLTYLDTNKLLENNWHFKQTDKLGKEFSISYKNLYFCYLPNFSYLGVQFSAPKVINGSNAMPFNFKDRDLLLSYIDSIANTILPNFKLEKFQNWIINRLDIFVDYKTANEDDKYIYINCISKLYFSGYKNTIYKTGSQAQSRSKNISIYSKYDEMQHRKDSIRNYSQMDYILNSTMKNTLRIELQLKKHALYYRFKDRRKVIDLLNYDTCKKLYLEFASKIGLNLLFLPKNELFDIVEKSFSKRLSQNLISFLIDYNEISREDLIKKYKKSTISNYLSKLKKIGSSGIYLSKDVTSVINFCCLHAATRSYALINSAVVATPSYIGIILNIKYLGSFKYNCPCYYYIDDG